MASLNRLLPAVAMCTAISIATSYANAPEPTYLAAYHSIIRPLLQRSGCASPLCHGAGVIALRLSPASNDDARDLAETLKEIRAGDPARSPLLMKPFGHNHLGGRNLAEGSCEAKLLASWIRGDRDQIACAPKLAPAGVTPTLPDALRVRLATCADLKCHGGPAQPRLLDPARPGAVAGDAAALLTSEDFYIPTRSELLARMLGKGDHPRSFISNEDPAYREIASWIAGAPPLPNTAPSLAVFTHDVQPILDKRGCTASGCHGAKGASLTLIPGGDYPLDNYLRLVPRIAVGLFPQKPRNRVPHGGGERLGAGNDCATTTIQAWIDGTPAPPCKPLLPPDRTRFETMVQPSLEVLTCPRCHGTGKLPFHLVGHPDRAALAANYREVLAHVDVDHPPVSEVLLRVNEPCMQARIMAWVGRTRDPGCRVELKNFRGSFPGERK